MNENNTTQPNNAMASPSQPSPPYSVATTIDLIGEDLLQNIVTRLPALSFASVACVNSSWNLVCDRVLCRPKLASACSFNSPLQVAVEVVVNKVLSEPIRPHFAIVSVGRSFDFHQAHQLINAKLGSKVPVITNKPFGIIGKDAVFDEFKEILWEITEDDDDPGDQLRQSESVNRAIMLIVGFLPGIKVKAIPLLKQIEQPRVVMIDNFVAGIREFSTSISGCRSPAAIIMFSEPKAGMRTVMEKMDHDMSPETVIVGDSNCLFLHSNGSDTNTTIMEEHIYVSVALVFAVDRNKPPGMGETRFHAMLSNGLSPVGPTYKASSVREVHFDTVTLLTARREGLREEIGGETILNQVYDELEDGIPFPTFYIGVTKRRKCSVGKDKVGWMTSLAFHEFIGDNPDHLFVGDVGIKTGDIFRFYHSDSATASSSIDNISNQLKSIKESSTSRNDKKEVLGGLIFTSWCRGESFFSQRNVTAHRFWKTSLVSHLLERSVVGKLGVVI